MREAYRLNKTLLIEMLEEKHLQVHIAFNYVSDDELDFAAVEKKMKLSLQKLVDRIELV